MSKILDCIGEVNSNQTPFDSAATIEPESLDGGCAALIRQRNEDRAYSDATNFKKL